MNVSRQNEGKVILGSMLNGDSVQQASIREPKEKGDLVHSRNSFI